MLPSNVFNRDLSWLSFNGRVLEEAANEKAPLLERVKFLGIFSSNLDEFYRVRIPVIKALQKIGEKKKNEIDQDEQLYLLQQATQVIRGQQERFGTILVSQLIPQLKENNISLIYNEPAPPVLAERISEYFLATVLAYLHPVVIDHKTSFFPENNKLYFIVQLNDGSAREKLAILNIPSDDLPRFLTIKNEDTSFVCFIDDVIRFNLDKLFKDLFVVNCFSFKITRDAELDLKDEYADDLAVQLESQLKKRDLGYATRFLFESGTPLRIVEMIRMQFNLQNATAVEGGRYHNLKDLAGFPVDKAELSYDKWPAAKLPGAGIVRPISSAIMEQDMVVHTPYNSYDLILRFFNEAANDPDVVEISVSLYRVASDSKIVHALISAAKNGKQVRVVVELKARFDEANNLKWAKKMKEAGVRIIYSIAALKIHAKIALVKTKKDNRFIYTGLLATGNFNEGTAKFYTDHILLTADHRLLREVELLFAFLAKREKPAGGDQVKFEHLLVAPFNLQRRFLDLIDHEISLAKQGLPAQVTIKVNNLEESVLINKLYEASQAGVKIELIVRSICCLIPGEAGLSENITITRLVDRYLEHGRIFIFNNSGDKKVFLGSADWMNRNVYNRIEVCFPIYDTAIKQEVVTLMNYFLGDDVQAVQIDPELKNIKKKAGRKPLRAQQAIYQMVSNKIADQ